MRGWIAGPRMSGRGYQIWVKRADPRGGEERGGLLIAIRILFCAFHAFAQPSHPNRVQQRSSSSRLAALTRIWPSRAKSRSSLPFLPFPERQSRPPRHALQLLQPNIHVASQKSSSLRPDLRLASMWEDDAGCVCVFTSIFQNRGLRTTGMCSCKASGSAWSSFYIVDTSR